MTSGTENLAAGDLPRPRQPASGHDTTASGESITIAVAEGNYLYDGAGRRYLDGISALGEVVHGHGEPDICGAMRDQLTRMDRAAPSGQPHEPGAVLAERLVASAPEGFSGIRFASDGAAAAGIALAIAHRIALRGDGSRHRYVRIAAPQHGGPLDRGTEHDAAPYVRVPLQPRSISSPGALEPEQARVERTGRTLAELGEVLAREGDEVCALLIEPMVQVGAGMLTYDASFLRIAAKLAREHDALLIADERATGFGRSGRMWAVEHAGVVPDLLICGSGLTGGALPMAAVLMSADVHAALNGISGPADTLTGYTAGELADTAYPLGCAAALANLDLMAERATVEHAAKLGELLGEQLAPLRDYNGVREVRRLGVMAGVEIVPDGERTAWQVCLAAQRRGVWLQAHGDTVLAMPPLGLDAGEIEELGTVLTAAVGETTQ